MRTFKVYFVGLIDSHHKKIRAHSIEEASKKIKRRFKGHFGYLIEEVSP